mmetsp:Transcript_105753/g.203290  ORF Transcript_105753/g.203290 Transcript_105753/m.203290 type:complete len:204 (+) Transcript_105753:2299-2910(+)
MSFSAKSASHVSESALVWHGFPVAIRSSSSWLACFANSPCNLSISLACLAAWEATTARIKPSSDCHRMDEYKHPTAAATMSIDTATALRKTPPVPSGEEVFEAETLLDPADVGEAPPGRSTFTWQASEGSTTVLRQVLLRMLEQEDAIALAPKESAQIAPAPRACISKCSSELTQAGCLVLEAHARARTRAASVRSAPVGWSS